MTSNRKVNGHNQLHEGTGVLSDGRDLVAELAAKQAVTEQLHSYCRGLDRMDRVVAESVWHPDGTADYGPGYRGSASGFLDFVWEFHAGYDCHSHLVSNILIDVYSAAASAASETYVAVWLRTAAVEGMVTDQFHRGRYLDRWSLRDNRWAIDHRLYVGDLVHEAQHVASPANEYAAPGGRRDRADLSYTVLGHRS